MKIAVVAGTFPKTSETFVKRHVECLSRGESVLICHSLEKGYVPERPTFIINHQSHEPGISKKLRKCINFAQGRGFSGLSRQKMSELEKFLFEHNIDCILTEFGILGVNVLPVVKKLNMPLFTYFRGYDASSAIRKWHVRLGMADSVDLSLGIFAVSEFLIKNLSQYGISHSNYHIIPSGVDTKIFLPKPKDPNQALYVGRFVEKKNPLLIIRAFLSVCNRHPEARLIMIGDGPLLDQAKALIESHSHGDKIQLIGAQDHSVVREYMGSSGIFLQHSVTAKDGNTEGLPSAIQEAMSCGCAVLATRHAGIPYLIKDNENGFLVDEFAEQQYAEALSILLNNVPLQKKCGDSNRAVAEERLDCWYLQNKLETIISETIISRSSIVR